MSEDLAARMELIKASLQAACPLREVTRDARDLGEISEEEFTKGVYSIASLGERNYVNNAGYIAKDGRQGITITGDFKLPANEPRSKIEDAEFAMMAEIKAWLRNLPDELCMISLVRFSQSNQASAPHGWIVAELEYVS